MKGKGDGTKWEEDSEESLCNLIKNKDDSHYGLTLKLRHAHKLNSKFTIDESRRNKKPIDFVTKG